MSVILSTVEDEMFLAECHFTAWAPWETTPLADGTEGFIQRRELRRHRRTILQEKFECKKKMQMEIDK